MAFASRVRLVLMAALMVLLVLPAAFAHAATLTRSGTTTITDTLAGDTSPEQLAAQFDSELLTDDDMVYFASSGITESITDCQPVAGVVRCETPPDRVIINGSDGADQIVFTSGFFRGLAEGPTGTINGGAQPDTITGSVLDDVINGDAASDTVTPGRGADTITCDDAAPSDAVSYDDGRTDGVRVELDAAGVDGTDGIDHDGVTGEVVPPACDILIGSDNNDILTGDDGTNELRGGEGSDTIDAKGSNDTVIPGPGGDGEVFGGDGEDTVSYDDGRPTGVTASLGLSVPDGDAGEDLKDFENLIGSEHDDRLLGDGGVNEINGGDGDDVLFGGGGADDLDGDLGTDTISCDDRAGPVTILNLQTDVGCDAGETTVQTENAIGTGNNDTLTGDTGDNRLEGGNGNDSLIGSSGDDTIVGGGGDDAPDGGTNTSVGDTVSYEERSAAVVADISTTTGDDGDVGEDAIGFENLTGGDGNDTLTGTTAANRIDGGPGSDTIRGLAGGDTLIGGGGTGDLADYSEQQREAGVVVDLSAPGPDGDAGESANGFEGIIGTRFNDELTGSTGNDVRIDGLAGDDLLRGNLGNDALDGGEGTGDTASYDDAGRSAVTATTVTLEPGGDNVDAGEDPTHFERLAGGPGPDTLVGSGTADELAGRGGDDVLQGGGGADKLDGGAGTDVASYATHPDAVAVTLGSGAGDDGSGFDGPDDDGRDQLTTIESVAGSPQGDTLTGDDNANALSGGGGDDTLRGGGGADTLTGDEGRDTATYSERADAVFVALDGSANDGAAGEGDAVDAERVVGGEGDDTLTGNNAANGLLGGAGADTVTGLAGTDVLEAGDGDDDVRARDGEIDTVDCGGDGDKLQGDPADQLTSCEQADLGISDRDADGIEDGQDCAPDDAAIRPGATEIKGNDVDENCDGVKEALPPPDADGDGQSILTDCNDGNAAIRPGALEIPGNKIDENCDRIVAPFPPIAAEIRFDFARTRTTLLLRNLNVQKVPAGTTIVSTCKGRGCAFKSNRRSVRRATKLVRLAPLFKGRALGVGARVQVTVTAPDTIGKVLRLTVRRGKPPQRASLCLTPGTRTPARCVA